MRSFAARNSALVAYPCQIVHALVELLGPQPHPGAAERIGRLERRIGKPFVEILVDDVGFRNDHVAGNERGHDRTRIELDVPVLLVLPRAQIEMLALPREALFGETEAYLLRAARHVVVVERQHLCVTP